MPRHYPAELRRQARQRMLAGEPVKDLVEELDVTMETLCRWRRQALIDTGQRPGSRAWRLIRWRRRRTWITS
jgi:transposase-like protein